MLGIKEKESEWKGSEEILSHFFFSSSSVFYSGFYFPTSRGLPVWNFDELKRINGTG